MPVESALKIGVLDFAASQRHRFENPFMAKRGVLILFLRRSWALAVDRFVDVPILFSHKKIEPALGADKKRDSVLLLSPSVQQEID
jgi:hypothetical protein